LKRPKIVAASHSSDDYYFSSSLLRLVRWLSSGHKTRKKLCRSAAQRWRTMPLKAPHSLHSNCVVSHEALGYREKASFAHPGHYWC